MPLSEAKADLETWWTEFEANPNFTGGGFSNQRGLNNQIQRVALDKAHKIATQRDLSEDETTELGSIALAHCKAPRVK